MSVGISLILAVVKEKSRTRLLDIPSDFLQTDHERRLYRFVRKHVSDHDKFPSIKTLRMVFSSKFEVSYPPEPSAYYRTDTERRAAYNLIREPYARLTEAMQGADTDFEHLNTIIEELSSIRRRFSSGGGVEDSRTLIARVFEEYEDALSYHGIRGVHTGYQEVDDITNGWQPEDLIMLVGRPSVGKSFMLMQHMYRAWQNGHRCLWISNEMGAIQSMRRLIGFHTGINPTLIKRGEISTRMQQNFRRMLDEMNEMTPLNMVTSNFDRSTTQVEAFIEQFDPDIVFADAAYLFKPERRRAGSGSRRETIGDVAEELKRITTDARRPIMGSVQFSRQADQRMRAARSVPADRDNPIINPVKHLSLDVIGETDIIGQVVDHAIGVVEAPAPYSREMRGFGFLKGREGETGDWFTNYPRHQSDRIDLSIVPNDDERLATLRRNARNAGRGGEHNADAPPPNENMLNHMLDGGGS